MPCAPTSLKRLLFVDSYDSQFVQCVSPIDIFNSFALVRSQGRRLMTRETL
ncbi:hypothetical protein NUACC26_028090 [Scytonema sp. NUACC26]